MIIYLIDLYKNFWMSVESELMIKEYEKNPLCNYEMKDPDVMRHEGNFIC
jgi:hypothetical protein